MRDLTEVPTFGSLFAGIGGFDLGLERAGWTCAFQCEIDPFCQRVLARHWPSVERRADISNFASNDLRQQSDAAETRGNISRLDLLCGGFPCQDLSVAGKRAGLAGERSGLFWEFLRVADRLQPRWLLLENVPGLLSSRGGRDFGALLEGLEVSGYWWAYRILDSQHFGVAQRRRRVFMVGHRGGPCPPAVLFEPASGARHPAPDREAGARVAASLTVGTLSPGAHPGGFNGQDAYSGQFMTGPLGGGNDGIGRRTEDDPNLVVGAQRHLGSGGPDDNEAQAGHLIPFDTTQITSAGNYSHPKAGDPCHPLAAGAHPHAIAHTLQAEGADASEDGTGRWVPMITYTVHAQNANVKVRHAFEDDQSRTLDGMSGPDKNQGGTAIQQGSSVRRLTPTECERLQGFPDGWTCLCGVEPYTTLTCRCPDSARYRAMGNAVTVPVIVWLGSRLLNETS